MLFVLVKSNDDGVIMNGKTIFTRVDSIQWVCWPFSDSLPCSVGHIKNMVLSIVVIPEYCLFMSFSLDTAEIRLLILVEFGNPAGNLTPLVLSFFFNIFTEISRSHLRITWYV